MTHSVIARSLSSDAHDRIDSIRAPHYRLAPWVNDARARKSTQTENYRAGQPKCQCWTHAVWSARGTAVMVCSHVG